MAVDTKVEFEASRVLAWDRNFFVGIIAFRSCRGLAHAATGLAEALAKKVKRFIYSRGLMVDNRIMRKSTVFITTGADSIQGDILAHDRMIENLA